jgi:hypothetical protein
VTAEARSDDLVALDEGLGRPERHEPDAARLVRLRALGAADRLWALARAWLLRQLSK